VSIATDAEVSRPRNQGHLGLAAREARKRGDVDALLHILAGTDRIGRLAAAQDLGELRDTRAVVPLVRCLQASDELLQVSALKALARIGDRSVLQDVFDVATGDEPLGVRATASETLGRLGDERAAGLLGAILAGKPNPYPRSYRRWAAKLLIDLYGAEAIPHLEAARAKGGLLERWRVKRAISALRRMRNTAGPIG
jgi:HEAT repeat protein